MKFRPTIVQKLVASYAIITALLLFALVYAILTMDSISKTAGDIARRDLAATAVSIALKENFIEQQRSVGRFLIAQQPEYKMLYEQENEEFYRLMEILAKEAQAIDLSELEKLSQEFGNNNARLFHGEKISSKDLKTVSEKLEKQINIVGQNQKKILEQKLANANAIKSKTISRTILIAFLGVSLTICVATFIIYSLSTSISKLKKATRSISEGDFHFNPQIPHGDELGELALDFMVMAGRLKELEELSLDASPLTRLPGNIAIERSINHRLANNNPFAMCYLDLDNFKSYNDRYGYIRASEMLQDAGRVIYEAVKTIKDPDAFVGHIGGDDFVVIVTADSAEAACKAIISAVDSMVIGYYSEEDCRRGYIEGEDRYGVFRKFPLVSISIAALICRTGDYGSAAEIATAAARVKDRVKESSGSNFSVVERRDYDAA